MWVPARRHDPEIMDRRDNPADELAGALADIVRVNRYLGGTRALLCELAPLLEEADEQPIELLDVGTGAADIPLGIAREARRRGKTIRITAIDRDPRTAAIACDLVGARPDVAVLCADAFALPFPDRSFDVVTVSMFLHHFDHDDVVRLLTGFARVARKAVVINDLRRHWIPWGFIWAIAHLTRRHPMFVHDAPLSVLRGFTPQELDDATQEAGLVARIRRRWPFRLMATVPSAPR